MNFDEFFQHSLSDTEVKVMELLHENIRRQSFFGKAWPAEKNPSRAGKKMLYESGDMQAGYMSHIEGDGIHITNTVDYAGVHNEGADITVTAQMKKFFWAMYYKSSGAMTRRKSGAPSASKRNAALGVEAGYWKSLALMKIGKKIHIPERRVMGESPVIDDAVERIVDSNIKEAINEMMQP